jgi:hypothetical protein
MKELEILDEIRELLFPLREEELKLLEESVKREGIRDPLVVWEKDDQLILLDGFHRYQLAKKYNLKYEVKILKHIKNIDEAKLWVIANQIGRRTLTDEQRTYAIGKYYELLKKEPYRPKKEKTLTICQSFLVRRQKQLNRWQRWIHAQFIVQVSSPQLWRKLRKSILKLQR